MAVITQTILPGERRNEVTDIQKAVISLGATIAPDELFTATTAGRLGATTQAAIIAFLARFGFPQHALPHFNPQIGRLLNIATAAELGNSAGLRQAVRESFAVIQTEPVAGPSELAVLARYAVIAQDFATGRKIIDLIPDNSSVAEEKRKIAAIVAPRTPQPSPAPELLNPENYYTVQYDYVARSTIDRLVRGS